MSRLSIQLKGVRAASTRPTDVVGLSRVSKPVIEGG